MPRKETTKKVIDHILTEVPKFKASDLVGNTIKAVRSFKKWDTINYIYVVDEDDKLEGVVSIKELVRASDTLKLGKIMTKNPVSVSPSADQEQVALVALRKNIKTVPVVQQRTKDFLGVIGTDDIINILNHGHVSKMFRMSGISKQHPTVDIFKISPWKLYKIRIPWLLIGLSGGIIATMLVGGFETTLRKEISLSFFIPVLVYISNAIAIQAQILLIRKLVDDNVKNLIFLKKELAVSITLALTSAFILCTYAYLWLRSFSLALTIGLAVLVSTIVAVIIATAIPLILFRMKKDPALGSGPMATAIQDISTLLIYFLIATVIIL